MTPPGAGLDSASQRAEYFQRDIRRHLHHTSFGDQRVGSDASIVRKTIHRRSCRLFFMVVDPSARLPPKFSLLKSAHQAGFPLLHIVQVPQEVKLVAT